MAGRRTGKTGGSWVVGSWGRGRILGGNIGEKQETDGHDHFTTDLTDQTLILSRIKPFSDLPGQWELEREVNVDVTGLSTGRCQRRHWEALLTRFSRWKAGEPKPTNNDAMSLPKAG